MPNSEAFVKAINQSYAIQSSSIYLGAGILEGSICADASVHIPLRMMNRHGLIAGATGSGKTRTLQVLAEQLSAAGVPVFMSDIKGDLSGLAKALEPDDRIRQRASALQIDYRPADYPVELYSLSGEIGAQMRATVTEMGPNLLGKILQLNDTQVGVLAVLFKYADDKKLPVVDLADLKKVLSYLSEGVGKEEIKDSYGSISSSTATTILRKIVALEQQGVGKVFGEKSFDIEDLLERVDGRGVISLLNVSDMQSSPAVYSTFLLGMLAELYQKLPEAGDLDKPKLVFFLDEAHLLFNEAPKVFLEQVEQVIRLIRSKGVGIFFCTQMAQDIPASVLSQLGNRIQHVLRVFTPNDSKALKETVQTYPRSSFYDIGEQLTKLGIGQALVTVLNEKGIPTEVVATHLTPPTASMGPLPTDDYQSRVRNSTSFARYSTAYDPESAHEILARKMDSAQNEEDKDSSRNESGRRGADKSMLEDVMSSPVAKQIGRELVRGLFGMFFGSKRR